LRPPGIYRKENNTLSDAFTPEVTSTHHQEIDDRLLSLFKASSDLNASDIHLKTGYVPFLRVDSQLRTVKHDVLELKDIVEMVDSLMSPEQRSTFMENGSVDLAYEIPNGDRFRINIFRQRDNISLAARRVTRKIPSFEQLHLPPYVEQIADLTMGLVLLAGPTGSGKSTTIAAMLQHVNSSRRCHIVTIEDPIEYLYENELALVNQREIGIDCPDFATALRAMVREDPDVVLIGEMRDRETFETALQAAETGHLVFGTIHANTADQTVTRILDLFDTSAHPTILQGLAFNLQAVVCQKLLPCVKEKEKQGIRRVPAVEVMRSSPSVRDLLQKQELAKLVDVIRNSPQDGMATFTQSLNDLIMNDMVEPKIALEAAPNQEELRMLMKGISQSKGGLIR
jgi:twitching motility protein PilT